LAVVKAVVFPSIFGGEGPMKMKVPTEVKGRTGELCLLYGIPCRFVPHVLSTRCL